MRKTMFERTFSLRTSGRSRCALVLSTDQEHSRACYILDRQYQNTHTYQTQTKDSMKMHDDYSEGQSVNLYFRSAAPNRTSKEF